MVDRYNARGLFRNSQGGDCNSCNTRSSCGACGSREPREGCGGCGSCEKGNNGECHHLLERLKEVDFSLIDTVLYLDAYPHCAEALCYYHKLKKEREEIVHSLAHKCNMPVTSFNNASECEWSWTDKPWPWEHCAN